MIAVEDKESIVPATGILKREDRPEKELIQWWGNYAWEWLGID